MKLLEELGIETNWESIYEKALTHTSYANENHKDSYERLEFLGDAVLEVIISEYLYKNLDYKEGQMTKLRSHYVCEDALYKYSNILHLNEYILLGKGEKESSEKNHKAIIADIFESFTGALFLDKGFDTVKEFIYKNIIPLIENKEITFETDYKSVLQEWVQTDKKSLEYIVIKEEGPSHDKMFTVEVKIDNIVYGIGSAHSKKEAEQEAARDALMKAQGNFCA